MAMQTRRSTVLDWNGLVLISGLAALFVLTGVALANGDLEAGAVAAGFALSLGLLRWRGGFLGRLGIGLLSGVTLFFMLTAAVTNVRAGSPVGAVVLSGGLASIALSGLVSAVVAQVTHGPANEPGRTPLYVVAASLLAFVGLSGWSLASGGPTRPPADAALVAENVAFSTSGFSVAAGEVTVSLANQDLFWHTFTIETLGIDLPVPVGATRFVTFDVQPGTYQFKCRIPGHTEAGMVGTLIVTR
jgi:plastocyanin